MPNVLDRIRQLIGKPPGETYPDIWNEIDYRYANYGKRKRLVYSIHIPNDVPVITMLSAAKHYLSETNSDVKVVNIEAFFEPSQYGRMPATIGQAWVSRDGKGWGGDGFWDITGIQDNGMVFIELNTKWEHCCPIEKKMMFRV